MQQHSETWSRIVANGDFRLETVAVIDGVEYSTITAPVITNGLLTDKKLSVGNCIAGTLEFSVMTNNPIAKSAQVVIKSRVTDETTYSEWLEFGTFWVDHRSVDESLDEKLTTLVCFDAMLKGNQPYADNSQTVVWPKPMTTVVARICEQMGVQLDSRTVIKTGSDYVVTKPDDESTLLDILSWIGQLHGGNWTITQQGKLRLVPLVSAPSETFYVIDENGRRILTPEGDNLAWKSFASDVTEGVDYINVPVILGDVTTSDLSETTTTSESSDLGAYTLISGSFNSGGAAYFQGIVGSGVDAQKTTANYYSSISGQRVVFRYDMSVDLPSGTSISHVYLEVNGHAESASAVSEYMCVRLVSGNTYLSDEYNFKTSGTSNTTVTLECTTIPTVEQVASMQLECKLGYYGGAINGATLHVEYVTSVTNIKESVTGVSITVDSETTYATGTDAGIVLAFENPYATQNICNDLFAQVNGLIYATFNVTRAVFDPTVELGDLMYAGSLVQGVIYNTVQRYDIMYQVDVSAPGEEELDSEYPVITPVQKMQYTVSELKSDNVVIHSEIRQTQSSITAEVTRATGAESALSSRINVTEGNITAEVTRATNAETSIQQNYTPRSSIKSVFALDPTNITLSAGVDQQGNPTGQITFNAGSLIVNSTNFSLDANGIMTCNGAVINGEVTTAYGNKKAVLSNAGLNFYQNSTLKGRISFYNDSTGLGIDCGDLVLDCDHISLPYDPEELPIEAVEDTIYVVTDVNFSTNTVTYMGLHFIHGILAETVD